MASLTALTLISSLRTKIARWTPKFALNPDYRLYVMRCILASALFSVVIGHVLWKADDLQLEFGFAVTSQVVAITHHSIISLGPAAVSFPFWLDLLLTMFEAAVATAVLVVFGRWKSRANVELRWSDKVYVASHPIHIVFLASLWVMVILKLLDVASSPQCLSQPTTFSTLEHRVRIGNDSSISQKARYTAKALFGTKPWEEKVPGESKWISRVRGVATCCTVAALVSLCFYTVLVLPLAEAGQTPTKDVRIPVLPSGFQSSSPIVWNLAVEWKVPESESPETNSTRLAQLLHAAQVRRARSGYNADGEDLCIPSEKKIYESDLGLSVLVVFCCTSYTEDVTSFWDFYRNRKTMQPDLSLTVNFAALMVSANEQPGITNNFIKHSVQVYLALTDDVDEVRRVTRPTPLFLGSNLLSVATFKIRQRQVPLQAATFGIGEKLKAYMMSEIAYVATNTRSNNFNLDVGTMRVIADNDYAGDWIAVRDYRERTVMGGFATLGGLGSFIGALFLWVFGTSIVRALRGSKPYDPFGIIHDLDAEAAKILEECMSRYPAIQEELLTFRDHQKRGVVAFLFDTLIEGRHLGLSTELETRRPTQTPRRSVDCERAWSCEQETLQEVVVRSNEPESIGSMDTDQGSDQGSDDDLDEDLDAVQDIRTMPVRTASEGVSRSSSLTLHGAQFLTQRRPAFKRLTR